ncbi:MAG: HlyD family efflux transporter periplasmic adaptor subunit [Bacteroidaceae bacterium]|nr:HlyD family efflux transporter periplasmic adaptor subunit [Bacteroides sp.]MBQ4589289.1 HlyD family efflux transporter periplasmic adaptor subunit [Bacteroidaceae bacterium]
MEEKQYKDIELRSEEVQEVMNKVPPAILRYGIGILATIVFVLLIGSAFFRYPETIQVEVTLTTLNPPAYIKSANSGRLEQLYTVNGQPVKKGDILVVMENVANTEDILQLRARLSGWQERGSRLEQLDMIFFYRIPKLGNVQGAYASCLSAWNNYLQHAHENRIHETDLNNAIALLITSLGEWENTYLPTAPVDGKVAYMQLWKEGQYVDVGETMFVIVPNGESEYVGKALLPMQGSGKVEIGQRAVVRLTGFPEQVYGRMEGKVVSISPVPDEDGNYVVEISLTEMEGKQPPTMKVMNGTAEIIVREQSLLKRIFTN